jgi:hypothetical protein
MLVSTPGVIVTGMDKVARNEISTAFSISHLVLHNGNIKHPHFEAQGGRPCTEWAH